MTRTACPLCRRRLAPETSAACVPCRAHLARQLAALPALIATARAQAAAAAGPDAPDLDPVNVVLPAGPVPAAPTGPIARHGSLAHSPAPTISSTTGDTPRVAPLPASVVRLALWVPGPAEPVAWLTHHLDRICDGTRDLERFAADLNHAVRDLRKRTGDTRLRIGLCPTEDCGTELLAAPHAREVTCPSCGTKWPRRTWLWLTDTLRAA